MNFLYMGKYKYRFHPIIEEIEKLPSHSKILELCFGDTEIAQFCKQHGYLWKGIDINEHFVKHAQQAGHEAIHADLSALEVLPKADLSLMIGSLYHFHPQAESMLNKMFSSSKVVVISEPVKNLSASKGLIGYLARRSANVGKGHEQFRYNESTLGSLLNDYCKKYNCSIVSKQTLGKDILVNLIKNGN
ncbi:MAG TPA: hypothetical protein VFU05_15990 [Cyclobacteriaceae bacterium]|nr:hypothetical protein [Cyclobacteriaceae bacterium]